jgi:hypothetical protein
VHAVLPQPTWQLPPPQRTGPVHDAWPVQLMNDASANALTESQLPWPAQSTLHVEP